MRSSVGLPANATGGAGKGKAEETVEAWYAGHRTTRAAGKARTQAALDAQRGKLRARRQDEDVVLEIMRSIAAATTGDEAMRNATRREIKRRLGEGGYTEAEKAARGAAARVPAARSSGG